MFVKLFENLSRAQFGILIALLGVLLVSLIVGIVIGTKKKEWVKPFKICAFSLIGALLAALVVVEFVERYTGESYYSGEEYASFRNEFCLYFLTAVMIVAIATLAFVLAKKKDAPETKNIAYASICIATSFALSYVKLFSLPQGGSVTLVSFLPLMLYSYMFGVRKGVLAGVIYGILQFIQSPWFAHPMQFLIEYPVAFCTVGLAGILHEREILDNKMPIQFLIGGIIVAIFRYICHVIAGTFIWGIGNDLGQVPLLYSLAYNSFVFVDMAFTIVVGCLLVASKSVRTMMARAAQ